MLGVVVPRQLSAADRGGAPMPEALHLRCPELSAGVVRSEVLPRGPSLCRDEDMLAPGVPALDGLQLAYHAVVEQELVLNARSARAARLRW